MLESDDSFQTSALDCEWSEWQLALDMAILCHSLGIRQKFRKWVVKRGSCTATLCMRILLRSRTSVL